MLKKSFFIMQKVQKFNEKVRASAKYAEIRAGDVVKIHRKIIESGKERIQVFEGIVISVKGRQSSSLMATVRRVSFGIGVEITIPLFSPTISKIEVVKSAKVRRAKLYYLRDKGIRISKLKTKELEKFVAKEEEEPKVEDENPPVDISAEKEKSQTNPEA